MNHVNCIKEVYKFDVSKLNLAYTNTDFNSFIVSSLSGNKINYFNLEDGKLNYPVSIYDNGFAWTNSPGPVAITYFKNEIIRLAYPLVAYLKEEGSSYKHFIVDEKPYYAKTDRLGNKVWELFDSGYSITYPTLKICFFLKGFNQLIALNNHTGKELWTYSLPKSFDYIDFTSKELKGKIIKILGVYKNNVWLLINNGALLALDTQTGNQTVHIFIPSFTEGFDSERQQNILNHIQNKNYGVFNNSSVNVQLDTERGVIFGFPYLSYAEIDLNDPTYPFVLWDIQKTLVAQKEENKPGFDSLKIGSWENNDVYVYDSFFDSNRFGVFDRDTKKMSWSEYFGEENEGWGAIQDLKYSNGYLYIHAKVDKSLHIYRLD